jgi:hypothetical protein
MNKKNKERLARLTPEEEKENWGDHVTEIWDNDPRYVFMT